MEPPCSLNFIVTKQSGVLALKFDDFESYSRQKLMGYMHVHWKLAGFILMGIFCRWCSCWRKKERKGNEYTYICMHPIIFFRQNKNRKKSAQKTSDHGQSLCRALCENICLWIRSQLPHLISVRIGKHSHRAIFKLNMYFNVFLPSNIDFWKGIFRFWSSNPGQTRPDQLTIPSPTTSEFKLNFGHIIQEIQLALKKSQCPILSIQVGYAHMPSS